jgi:hypothetical protein
MFLQADIEQVGGGFVIAVSAAFGFGNDIVDAAEFAQIGGRDAHGFGGQLFLGGIAPHDGGAALGRNHRVDRVLHHQNAVGNGDGQRSAAAANSDDGGDDGNFEACHLTQIVRDGLGLSTLFGMNSRDRRHRYRPG